MNKELLLEIASRIESEPEKFDMSNWFAASRQEKDGTCGTTACIAGWAVALESRKSLSRLYREINIEENEHETYHESGNIEARASLILGLDEYQTSALFYTTGWRNSELYDAYHLAREEGDSKAKAQAAADYIRWFVENN
jgi:hypothetical protein